MTARGRDLLAASALGAITVAYWCWMAAEMPSGAAMSTLPRSAVATIEGSMSDTRAASLPVPMPAKRSTVARTTR